MIAKLKQAKVDFVYYGGYHPELGLILRQAAEKGLKVGFMGPEGVGNKEISAIAGPASEGLYVTLPKSFDQDPKNQALVDAFKAKNEDPSGPFVFPAYAAVQVIAEGIKKAGSEDTDKVAAALRANTSQPRPVTWPRREGRPEELQLRGLPVAQGRHQDRSQVSHPPPHKAHCPRSGLCLSEYSGGPSRHKRRFTRRPRS